MLTLALFAALAFRRRPGALHAFARLPRQHLSLAPCLYFFAPGPMGNCAVFGTSYRPLAPGWQRRARPQGYLNREDAGLFLLPFAAATVIVAVVLVGKRRWKALAEQVIPLRHAPASVC